MNKLTEAINKGRLYNGYIICAREITAAYDCAMEIAAAVHTTPYIIEEPSMDNIRRLQTSLYEDVQKGDAKVAIIYGDKLSDRCQNAMLKTIEEHSGDIAIVFIITNMAVILPTIISRCITYYPPVLSEEELIKLTGGNLLAARYAMGSKNRAAELMNDAGFIKKRNKAVEILEHLKQGTVCVAGREEKEVIPVYLQYMLLYLRDALTKDIYWFFDKKTSVISYINTFTTEEIMSMIKAVKDGNVKINKNTNPMLVFDKVQLEVLEVINGNSNRGSV